MRLFGNPSESVTARYRRAIILCFILAVVVVLPGVWSGLFVDDYIHLLILDGYKVIGAPFDLFRFAPGDPEIMKPLMDRGPYPWWTLPELRVSFFRPLSSATAVFDHWMFGRAFPLWHLHSLCWYLFLILGYGLILRRVLPGPVGVLALILFTLDKSHWFPAVWIANRNALVATSLAVMGLYMHIRSREDRWRPGVFLSILFFAAGLTGGETSLGVFMYLAAYEFLGGPAATLHPTAALRRGGPVRALIPALLLGMVYIGIYRSLNYGAMGSGSYIDPAAEPLTYLVHMPARLFALMAALFLSIPADLWVFTLWIRPFLSMLGVTAVILMCVLIRHIWSWTDEVERRAVRWLVPGMLLSLLPVASTFPMNRLLLVPGLGGTVLVALFLHKWWNHLRTAEPRKKWTLANVAGWYLVVACIIVSPIAWTAQSLIIKTFGDRATKIAMDAEVDWNKVEQQHVVLLNAPDPFLGIYPTIIWAAKGRPWPAGWHVLSMAPHAHKVTRTAPNVIELEVVDGSMLKTEFEKLMRSPDYPFNPGDEVVLRDLTVRVMAVSETGPTKVQFTFDKPLEDASLCFLECRDSALRKATLPPVGDSVLLPKTRGAI